MNGAQLKTYTIFLGLLLGSLPALLWSGSAPASPIIPNDDTQVLERVRMPANAQARELRRLRNALRQDPHDLKLAVHLARRYREIGRAEADPRYYGYAQAVLGPWWHEPQPPLEVLVLRANLRQARHDFDGALDDLSRVLTVRSNNAQAWLTRAVILTVRGDYAGARRSCLALARLSSSLIATTCLSHTASLSGEAEKSYQLLRRVLENNPTARPQVRLWALTILAEIAVRLGHDRVAEQHFKQALALGLRNTYLLGAYTDLLLDQGRSKETRALLKGDVRPDDLLLRLALAERQLNLPQSYDHRESLRARFAASRLRGDSLHLRSEARFTLYLLDEPKAALILTQKNWALQREPWDARLLLEAALAANEPAAAQPVLDWLTMSRLEDVHLQRLVTQLEDGQK